MKGNPFNGIESDGKKAVAPHARHYGAGNQCVIYTLI